VYEDDDDAEGYEPDSADYGDDQDGIDQFVIDLSEWQKNKNRLDEICLQVNRRAPMLDSLSIQFSREIANWIDSRNKAYARKTSEGKPV